MRPAPQEISPSERDECLRKLRQTLLLTREPWCALAVELVEKQNSGPSPNRAETLASPYLRPTSRG